MGMFNTIRADVTCPMKDILNKDVEIQIKWQDHDNLWLGTYHTGNVLPGIHPEYDNTWIRTEYICDACSEHRKWRDGTLYVPTEGQVWHKVFVEIREGQIRQVLDEKAFEETGVTQYVEYC